MTRRRSSVRPPQPIGHTLRQLARWAIAGSLGAASGCGSAFDGWDSVSCDDASNVLRSPSCAPTDTQSLPTSTRKRSRRLHLRNFRRAHSPPPSGPRSRPRPPQRNAHHRKRRNQARRTSLANRDVGHPKANSNPTHPSPPSPINNARKTSTNRSPPHPAAISSTSNRPPRPRNRPSPHPTPPPPYNLSLPD